MIAYGEKIRERAKQLLEEGRVDLIIGFKQGTLPLMTEPVIIRKPEDADQLYWSSFCSMNLANYLPKRKEKIGIIAKGCDSRNIAVHIVENQIKRDQLYIIGIPCKGMVDRRKLQSLVGDKEIREVIESEDQVIIKGTDFEETVNRSDYLQDNCITCMHRNPVVYDEMMGEMVAEREEPDPYDDVKEIEAMGSDERWGFFSDLVSSCIRCYACRNACPLCYCPTCFVDESDPQWVGKSIDPTDTLTFHILRAFHCAGRCTDCGACQQACPVDINMRLFTRRLNKDALELYGCEAGLSIEERPPLDTYRPDDYDNFIK
ncbi:MAG: 4Fe-4S ferredoxin [Thermodesulfobacteriota bacterium]